MDSADRFDPPWCAQSTRLAIVQQITDWANDDNMSSSIFWLHGGAGAGKSALAQTLAETFKRNEKLGASFFFFREAASRSDGNTLIPTIVLQLIRAFPGLAPFVEDKIRTNKLLFSSNRQTQAVELLFEPLLRLSLEEDSDPERYAPHLIVIDGLDECADPDVQCDLLRIVAGLVPHLPYPFRFLIASRPESHIVHTFDFDLRFIKVHQYNLSTDLDAAEDIRKFLEQEFQRIHNVHPLRHHLRPGQWPKEGDISSLILRSSRHFIYASTVIRYIGSRQHRPDDRLKVILDYLPPPGKDNPYAELDALYTVIFRGVEEDKLETTRRALGLLHLHNEKRAGIFERGDFERGSDHEMIETILNLQPGDTILLFDPLLSLIAFKEQKIQILHKSLFEYLLDQSRSDFFYLDLAWAHEAIATHILEKKILEKKCGESD